MIIIAPTTRQGFKPISTATRAPVLLERRRAMTMWRELPTSCWCVNIVILPFNYRMYSEKETSMTLFLSYLGRLLCDSTRHLINKNIIIHTNVRMYDACAWGRARRSAHGQLGIPRQDADAMLNANYCPLLTQKRKFTSSWGYVTCATFYGDNCHDIVTRASFVEDNCHACMTQERTALIVNAQRKVAPSQRPQLLRTLLKLAATYS